ncbi:ATP-NAD kinase-like domain-containing protein [Collybia nuda]|uniref:ATP-NAD kinase-like domain-containing protein n=1 Tax=Collybia nuda TaxID=64659 RepID=A0A9P5Y719_9AGAR|nr:ATP-NAD kinase-like domain-containing protein [Collybia nuda]
MHVCYEGFGIQRRRRLKILVNPHGGVRRGVPVFVKTVEPILRAAHCFLDITYTEHNGHAYDIAKTLPLDYDAVVTVSGDGLIHEVMNGFSNHEQPRMAFRVPIAPIPTGSGNGLALNLLGIERGFDVTEATLNVIKGKHMKVDVFSLTQKGKRTISFMSQALGLMADLDIGTEHLRWMGDTRFMVGLMRGVIQFKPCPVHLSIKVAEEDKEKMVEMLRAHRCDNSSNIPNPPSNDQANDTNGGLPPLTYSCEDTNGWTTFPEPILYIYAGKGPYVGRDFMAFPVSLPDDGLIDVMAMPISSRSDILSSLGGAAKGDIFWHPKVRTS